MEVKITKVNSNKIQGYRFFPETSTNDSTVITFGGSEGSCWFNMGFEIAQKGYNVLSLYYYGKPNLPHSLNKIDISFFDEIIFYIKENINPSSSITIVGASRGAELALLLATQYKQVSNVVLFSPSAFIFSGTDKSSAWTIDGEELPHITFSFRTVAQRLFNRKLPLVNSFRSELKHSKNYKKSKLDVSKFTGNILMFAGVEDLTWPSADMGKIIESDSISAASTELHTFENAGHTFSNVHYDGGDSDGNLYAFYTSQKILQKKLKIWSGN